MRRSMEITTLGFTCFRLEHDGPGYAPVELLQATTRMFAFVNRRLQPPRRAHR